MRHVRKISLDSDKCIGCQACTHACPEALFRLSDAGGQRVIEWPNTCTKDCAICADACFEGAIELESATAESQEILRAMFPLKRCQACGRPYATQKMMSKLDRLIPDLIKGDDDGWLARCIDCRQTGEAVRISTGLLTTRAVGS